MALGYVAVNLTFVLWSARRPDCQCVPSISVSIILKGTWKRQSPSVRPLWTLICTGHERCKYQWQGRMTFRWPFSPWSWPWGLWQTRRSASKAGSTRWAECDVKEEACEKDREATVGAAVGLGVGFVADPGAAPHAREPPDAAILSEVHAGKVPPEAESVYCFPSIVILSPCGFRSVIRQSSR
jgi:hypothetical protein